MSNNYYSKIMYAMADLANHGYTNKNYTMGHYLLIHPELKATIGRFNPCVGRGRKSFSSVDLFGTKLIMYYNINNPESFVAFLLDLFLTKNPNSKSRQGAFTRLLHEHNLHSPLCSHFKRNESYSH